MHTTYNLGVNYHEHYRIRREGIVRMYPAYIATCQPYSCVKE